MIFCYSDFTHTISDYFCALKKREMVYEIVIPILFSIVFYYYGFYIIPSVDVADFISSFTSLLVNVFAILVGFTIASIAIFTTVDHKKVELLSKLNERTIRGKQISNFRFIYLNLIYSAFTSIIMLVSTLSSIILSYVIKERVLISLLIFGTLHVLLLSMRNITTIYFAFSNLKAD